MKKRINGFFVYLGVLIAIFASTTGQIYAQKSKKPQTIPVVDKKKINQTKEAGKSVSRTTNLNEKEAIGERISINKNDVPPLLNLVVGQVTTINLPDSPLQIRVDRVGLNIWESTEKSQNKYVYIIPTQSGIRRNIVIELASGKVEFELRSTTAAEGKSAAFTREVEVKTVVKERPSDGLKERVTELETAVRNSEKEKLELKTNSETRLDDLRNEELRFQTTMLFSFSESKRKGRKIRSSDKNWEVEEIFNKTISTKTGSVESARKIALYKLTYRGKENSKFLDIKSDAGNKLIWKSDPEKVTTQPEESNSGDNSVTLARGESLTLAVIELLEKNDSGIIFAADNMTLKFNK